MVLKDRESIMTVLAATLRGFVVIGSGWLLLAALVAVVRTRQFWPAGRIILIAIRIAITAHAPRIRRNRSRIIAHAPMRMKAPN